MGEHSLGADSHIFALSNLPQDGPLLTLSQSYWALVAKVKVNLERSISIK